MLASRTSILGFRKVVKHDLSEGIVQDLLGDVVHRDSLASLGSLQATGGSKR
jgi:hypothetical protein